MQIDVLRPKDLGSLADDWRALQARDRQTDSPFLSPAWAAAVEEARGDCAVRVAVLSADGAAKAFMPAQTGKLTAIAAGGAMSDYEGLVGEAPAGFDPLAVVRALGVDRYDFNFAPTDQRPLQPYAMGRTLSWIVDVAGGYEPYAAGRRAAGVSALKELERKRRKASREAGPVTFTALSTSKADFDRLIALKRAQYRVTRQTDVFAAGWTLRLVERLFEERPAGCAGGLFTLHIGGSLAAAQFDLIGPATIHAWIIAHEPELERYSPGLLLLQEILRWMDDHPQDRLDLGYGDYRFKREFSNTRAELIHGFVGGPSAASLVRGAAWGVRRAAEALPLGAFSELPGKAMRRLDMRRGLR